MSKKKLSPADAGVVRIIVHIGAGKTGTSSIQETLRQNAPILSKQGIHYFGLVLDRAPVKRYEWQRPGAFREFFVARKGEVGNEFREVLEESIDNLVKRGGHTFILSNESFLLSGSFLIDVFAQLKAERGWEVNFVAYVRDYASWSKSSYVQWGIKHKAYKGKLKPYREWIRNSSMSGFAPGLKAWDCCSEIPLQVRNLHQAGNVVIDFCSTFGLPLAEIAEVRSNDAPSAEELALRALFNNRFDSEMLPQVFERLFGYHSLDFNIAVDRYLDPLMPSQEDVEAYLTGMKDDAAVVNALLERNGQQPLALESASVKPTKVDQAKMAGALFLMVTQLAHRMNHAEVRLRELSPPNSNA